MTFLVDSSVKVALLMLVALAASGALRHGAAAARHWLLAVAIGCALVTPALTLVLPSWTVSWRGATPDSPSVRSLQSVTPTIIPQNAPPRTGGTAARPVAVATPRVVSASQVIAVVWLAGAFLSGSLVLVGLARLKRRAAAAQPVAEGRWRQLADEISRATGVRRPIVLLQSEDPTLLVTWGWQQPKVLLPAAARGWSDERARIVLCHELAHVGRADWAAQMLGELLRALYWFNPLVWIACRRLRRESEHSCDDAVLQSGVDATDYASHLLELARTLNAGRRVHVPAPAMVRASSLEGRISAMLNARIDRRPLTASLRIVTAVALSLVTLSVAAAGQARFSTLSGVIGDQTSAFLPDATLVLTNTANKARYEVHSDANGHFEFVGLPAGDYMLQAMQPGFAPVRDAVTVSGRDLTRNIQLQLGELQETITIRGPEKSPAPADATATDAERARKREAVRLKAELRQRQATEKCAAAPSGGAGGNILQPWKVVDVKPVYPELLTSGGTGGTVSMEALIGTDGKVRDVRVVASPHPDLDRAAVDAVRQWEFTPTTLNCTPVEVRMQVTANFVAQP